eukprot:Gb_24368 [translate_table: standard]
MYFYRWHLAHLRIGKCLLEGSKQASLPQQQYTTLHKIHDTPESKRPFVLQHNKSNGVCPYVGYDHVDERQSNQIEEKEPTRKILLQELDPNAEDSNSMLTTSEPSINCIKSRKPPRMEVKQLNITENTCQQDHPKEEVEVLETHSNEIDRKLCSRKRLRWKLDLSAEASNYRLKTSMPSINSFKSLYSTRKKVKQLNMTEITHQQHVVKVELESDKRQTNQGDERHFNEVDEKHTTQRRPLQGKEIEQMNTAERTCEQNLLRKETEVRFSSIPCGKHLVLASGLHNNRKLPSFHHCDQGSSLRVIASRCLAITERKEIEKMNTTEKTSQQNLLRKETDVRFSSL